MTNLSPRRIVRAIAAAVALVALSTAVAVAWDATCSSGEACVWKNASFQVPLAAQATGDSDYTTDAYPNTQESLNDSVSSIRNRHSSNDVVWFFHVGYQGTSYCLKAGWQSGQLNSHNDQYSSHLIAVAGTCP
jgi:hypothetical protein